VTERLIIENIGSLVNAASYLDKPPTLPKIIQKLQLIQFSFERSFRQNLTQFVALGKILEQLNVAIKQHRDKQINLVGLLIPTCNSAKISVGQFMESDLSNLGKILGINLVD